MALFNIFLEKDDPNQDTAHLTPLTFEQRIEGWANEFVKKDDNKTDPNDISDRKTNSRTDPDCVKNKFIKPDVANDFLTSVVLSRKVLDILMQHPDFYGVRISLGINKEYDPGKEGQSNNCFVIVPVNSVPEDIMDGPDREFTDAPLDTYYCEDSTGFPPRTK